MKIGIFTFHSALNYGAVLQAYALQEYLKEQGHDVYIIDYRPKYLTKPYSLFRMESQGSSLLSLLKAFIRMLLVIPIRLKRRRAFRKFVDHYLNMMSLDLSDTSNCFDAFIFGSDQIWNTKITSGIDAVYCGDFNAARNKTLVSYAASCGDVSIIDNNTFAYLTDRLRNFSKVGIREKALVQALNNKTLNATHVIDPVLLAGRDVFKKIMSSVNIGNMPYLLFFSLGREEIAVPIAYKVANKLNLRVIEVISSKESIFQSNIMQTLSPEQFIGYIANAEYIITTSFHGTAFSILFKKNFTSVIPSSTNDDRIISLLEHLGLESRYVHSSDENVCTSPIDYNEVSIKYHALRQHSEDFIRF